MLREGRLAQGESRVQLADGEFPIREIAQDESALGVSERAQQERCSVRVGQ
jgi:hypothetical protein